MICTITHASGLHTVIAVIIMAKAAHSSLILHISLGPDARHYIHCLL